MPPEYLVGRRAREIFDLIADPDPAHAELYGRLVESAGLYCDGWGTHAGMVCVEMWDLEADFDPLFREAVRTLCLKAAVWELTDGDEEKAELVVPPPVDEMIHAVFAQANILPAVEESLGVHFPHMTDRERFGYEHGGYVHRCYLAAFGEDPNPRYWIDREETARRLAKLDSLYRTIGIERLAFRHSIRFN
jgi:hypothetical protein